MTERETGTKRQRVRGTGNRVTGEQRIEGTEKRRDRMRKTEKRGLGNKKTEEQRPIFIDKQRNR